MQVFIIGILWILWILTWMAVAIAGDPAPHKLHGPLLFIYRLILVGAMLLLITITPWPGFDVQYRFWERAPSEELAWAMVAVAFLGFTLAWWATILRLVAHKRGAIVIESGPFKFVRHPFYFGLILAAFATATMFGRPSSLSGAVVMSLAFLVKILIDDYALREEEPAYDDYAERVSMLLPLPRRRERAPAVARASLQTPPENLRTAPVITPLPVTAPEPTAAPEPMVEVRASEPETVSPMPEAVNEEEDVAVEPEAAMEPAPSIEALAPKATKTPSDVLSRAVQLSLTFDASEEDEAHAAAGLSEAVPKD